MSKKKLPKFVKPEEMQEITVKMNMNTYRRLVHVSSQLGLTPNQFLDKLVGDYT